MSSVEALVCPHCGADLDVPDGVTVLRCKYCGSKLQLKESGSVRALALIEKGLGAIGDNTARTADGVERLHLEVASQRKAARSRWLAKLSQMQAAENLLRGRAKNLRGWRMLFIVSSVPVSFAVSYVVFQIYQGQEKGALLALAAGIGVFLLYVIIGGVFSNRLESVEHSIEQSEEDLKAWKHREPL